MTPQNPFIVDTESTPLPDDRIINSSSQLTTAHRVQLINKTFQQYEQYRSQNHESTWALADKLYAGYVEPKKWPGTEKKRSDIGLQYLFDAVETTVPNIHNAIFASPDGFFQLSPEGETTTFEARALEDHLNYRFNKIHLKLQAEMVLKSMCQYGLGGWELVYEQTEPDPIKRLKIKWVDIKDMYFDPKPGSVCLEDCRSIIRRKKPTLSQILAYSQQPGFNPIDEVSLIKIASNPIKRNADHLQQVQDAFLRIADYGDTDEGAIKGDSKLELLMYYTKQRISWLVNGRYLLYDQPNPHQFYPFTFAPCFALLGRIYGFSFTDALKNIHRFGEGLLNAHFDLKAQEVIPPRAVSATSILGSQRTQWYPGAVFTYQNAKDLQVLGPRNSDNSVFADLDFLDRQAEKRIGPSLQGGIPRPSNANRTAGGMQMQLQGGATRNSTLIGHFDNLIIQPTIEKGIKMLRFHTNPQDSITVLNPQTGSIYNISAQLLSKDVNVCTNGLEKIITKQALATAYQPLYAALTQGPLGKYLFDQGMTVDWLELFNLLQRALGIPKIATLVRPLTEEEKQLAQQQQEQQQKAQQEASQAGNQVRLQMGQMKAQTDLQVAQLEAQTEQQKLDFQKWLQDEKASGEMMKMMFERFKLFVQEDGKREKESKGEINPDFPEDQIIRKLKVQQEGTKLEGMKIKNETSAKMANAELVEKLRSMLMPQQAPSQPNA